LTEGGLDAPSLETYDGLAYIYVYVESEREGSPMEDETKRILDLVAQGELTVDEATPRLEALRRKVPQVEPAEPAGEPSPASVASPVRDAAGGGAAQGFSFKALVEMKQQGVTPEFIRDLAIAGYPGLSAGMLVELRQQGVDARFIYELRDSGYERLSPHDLVEARQQGVSAAFIKELREAGYGGLSLDDLVEARQQGVDGHSCSACARLASGS
jgi:hypothetical protein